jgi:hypothetical protein
MRRPRSIDVTEGFQRAPARAMLRAIGMTEEDFGKPQIGVASSWNEVTPCNLPLARLARIAKEGVASAGGFPIEFTTIAVSDGISMGHEGMRASLVSREIIADSVEAVMHAERFDGMVTLAGCDKSLPGMVMAAARLDSARGAVAGAGVPFLDQAPSVSDVTGEHDPSGAEVYPPGRRDHPRRLDPAADHRHHHDGPAYWPAPPDRDLLLPRGRTHLPVQRYGRPAEPSSEGGTECPGTR